MNDWIGLLISLTYLGVIILISDPYCPLAARNESDLCTHPGGQLVVDCVLGDSKLLGGHGSAVVFVVFNALNAVFNWIPAINSKNRYKNLGTVYYAISVTVLTHLTFMDPQLRIAGGLGILAMGYGDGLAAVIGQFFGKHTYSIFRGHKSVEGTLAMLISVIACFRLVLVVAGGRH
jgi:dolichol kinase